MTDEHAVPETETPKAEAETAKPVKRAATVSLKVSEKGAVSVYGLGRFPVTLYREQWEKLLALSDQIKTFIADNKDKLKTKEQ